MTAAALLNRDKKRNTCGCHVECKKTKESIKENKLIMKLLEKNVKNIVKNNANECNKTSFEIKQFKKDNKKEFDNAVQNIIKELMATKEKECGKVKSHFSRSK